MYHCGINPAYVYITCTVHTPKSVSHNGRVELTDPVSAGQGTEWQLDSDRVEHYCTELSFGKNS
jgi:hypothetical protein